jgi:hypothetical protein
MQLFSWTFLWQVAGITYTSQCNITILQFGWNPASEEQWGQVTGEVNIEMFSKKCGIDAFRATLTLKAEHWRSLMRWYSQLVTYSYDQLRRALIVACEFRDVSGIGSLRASRPTTNDQVPDVFGS